MNRGRDEDDGSRGGWVVCAPFVLRFHILGIDGVGAEILCPILTIQCFNGDIVFFFSPISLSVN